MVTHIAKNGSYLFSLFCIDIGEYS